MRTNSSVTSVMTSSLAGQAGLEALVLLEELLLSAGLGMLAGFTERRGAVLEQVFLPAVEDLVSALGWPEY